MALFKIIKYPHNTDSSYKCLLQEKDTNRMYLISNEHYDSHFKDNYLFLCLNIQNYIVKHKEVVIPEMILDYNSEIKSIGLGTPVANNNIIQFFDSRAMGVLYSLGFFHEPE